ncbi:hypothetical protein BGW37DRAFT_486686 [Umbelopsis sp. PMI_123]|nr:hypothetical protein BGW37DRAFT_486686 [Umbelopsis sp. PMI_123]
MIPSELSMEALRNPSKQVDLLQFDDLGIDRLFDQTITPSTYLSILPMAPSKLAMEALRHPSKLFDLLKFDDLGIDKLFGQTIKTSDDLSIPPMVPSELSMEAFRHPSKQVDLLQFDDLGIDTLFDETIKPSDYLSIPPMAPSELSMEPLHHPSKQVDLLQFDDLGIDKLFWTPLATAGKSDLQNIAQKLSQEAAPNYNISKIKPPAVPSSLALECLFNPNPSSADWAWGVDDIGLKDLMSHERTLSHSRTLNEKMNRTHKVDQRPKKTSAVHEATGYQDSLDKIMNRTHKVDQRPKMTSALHEQTDYQSFCIPVVDPRPHALGLSQSSIFDSQDVTGDFDITQSTTGRVHATIQRPKAFQKDERRMGAKSTMVELPPEIYVRDSWSSYMAFKTSQEQPKQHLRYESPGSLARDKFEGQGEGRSQQPSLVQSTLVDVNEAVEQRKRRKREMRAENRKKDWADNMDDSQFETLFPAQFEGSADNVPQSKRSVTDTQHQVAEEPQVPTWTSTSSYGINAPYSLPPFSFESNARETAYPTDEEESKDWKSQNKNKFTMPATTPLHGVKADKDSESQDPQLQMNYKLHGLVDTVASGVGAVAGTAVGALSYWFSDSSHSTEEKPKQSSFSSNTAVNAGDQLYANETEGVQAISVVPDSHLTGAEEQLFMAKKDNPNLALGHVDDDTHVVNLHPSLLRPSERAELSTDQSLGSPGHNGNPSIGPQSELPRSLQYETGRTTKDRDLSSKYASQNIGGGTNADKNEPASDDEIRKLFNGDPDTVRQPFKTNQPHKTTMDDRRQIWEASMSTALGQAATTLGLQPQSKEKTLDLENYHVVNSGYKPSSYEPGRNQFDSDFENWKHDYPTRTSFNEGERKQNEGAQEHASDQAGNADNGQSDDSAQNVTNSSSQISGVPAWERAEFHDPSDYMKDTKSHTQHRHSRQPDPTTASSHHGRGPTGWIRRKLNKRHVRAER